MLYLQKNMGDHETGGWSKTGKGAYAPQPGPKTAID